MVSDSHGFSAFANVVAEPAEPESADPADPFSGPPLSDELAISFDYTRSLGPVLSRFAAGLQAGKIVGNKTEDGRIFVPPTEFDPTSGARCDDFVEVSTVGTVRSWTWQATPRHGQPLTTPFAWALIQLDGADTFLLHAVAADESELRTGLRVSAVFHSHRVGRIDDISHFTVGDTPNPPPALDNSELPANPDEWVLTTPISLTISHSATQSESRYLRGLKAGKIIGGRGAEGYVAVPPKDTSPISGTPGYEPIELSDVGTVTTFCIVNVPFLGQQIKPPYVAAYILLDGADIPFLHLILDCQASDVRMGMRVQAVWRDEDEWGYSLRNVSHFRPTGDPDAEFDTYRDHL